MRSTLRVLSFVAASTLAPVTGAGQEPLASDTAFAPQLAALARLRPGKPIRVSLRDGPQATGRFDAVRGPVLVILTAGSPPDELERTPLEVPLASMDTLWERRRIGPVGALIGIAGGALLGFVAAQEVMTEDEDGDGEDEVCDHECWQVTGVLSAVGAGAGFVVGLVVGLFVPQWEQRFP